MLREFAFRRGGGPTYELAGGFVVEWLPTVWLGAVAVVLLWAPGLALGFAGGLRGLIAWGAAPLLSGGVIGTAAVICGFVGVRWSPLVVVVVTAFAAAAAALIRIVGGGWRSPAVGTGLQIRRHIAWAVSLGVLLASAMQARRLLLAIGGPEQFPQTYDTPYHFNSVRLMLETGNASSLHMTLTTPDVSATFYPGLWHGLVALLLETSGTTGVVVAANWVTVLIASLVWPASVLVLARALFGPRPMLLGLTAVLSFAMTQFPNQLTAFGVLYPNLLSYALLPALLGLAWLALWRARGPARISPVFLAGVGTIAIVLAQPNGLFTLGYVLVPLLIHFVAHVSARQWRAERRGRAVGAWVLLLVVFVGSYWGVGQVPMVADFREQSTWPATSTRTQAVNDVLGLSAMHPGGDSNTLVAALVLVGAAVSLIVGRWRWLPFSYLILAWLFVVVASGEEPMRALVTGYWYSDPQRLAAQIPLIGVPLAALGLASVITAFARMVPPVSPMRDVGRVSPVLRPMSAVRRVPPALAIGAVTALLVVLVLPRTGPYIESFDYVRSVYATPSSEADDAFVDTDELAMMGDIERIVSEDATVAGNPWNGSSMTWALADRRSLFPHAKGQLTEDQIIIKERLADAQTDYEVCPAIERTGVEYVLTSDTWLWGNDPGGYEGLDPMALWKVGEVVAQHGDVRLYEITACE